MDEQQRRWRDRLNRLSQGASWASFGLLSLTVLGLVFLWCYAYSQGLFPNPRAPQRDRWDAAWGDNVVLSDGIFALCYLPPSAFSAAVFSAMLQPNARALLVIPCCVLCFFALIFHIDLVDD